MRTRLSKTNEIVAKDLSFIKEGGELYFNGNNIDDGKWVTIVGVPDEMDIDEDTEIECVDEKGNKLTCFADELSAVDPEGASADDPAHFLVAKRLRKAAHNFVIKRFAADGFVESESENDDVANEMRSWLLKQGQFKSCVDTLTNEIATNAVYDLLLGKETAEHSNATEDYAYDWANRLLKNQYGSMLGKLRAKQNAPEVPTVKEEELTEEVEVEPVESVDKTASRRRLTAKEESVDETEKWRVSAIEHDEDGNVRKETEVFDIEFPASAKEKERQEIFEKEVKKQSGENLPKDAECEWNDKICHVSVRDDEGDLLPMFSWRRVK